MLRLVGPLRPARKPLESAGARMSPRIFALIAVAILLGASTAAHQSFGIELLNNVMPASGAMGGASIARPQDLQSAIYGNPATLTQMHGTQFSLGSAWIEPTFKLGVAPPGVPLLFNVDPFPLTKSDAQGVAGATLASPRTSVPLASRSRPESACSPVRERALTFGRYPSRTARTSASLPSTSSPARASI